jgi:hypothetical protein
MKDLRLRTRLPERPCCRLSQLRFTATLRALKLVFFANFFFCLPLHILGIIFAAADERSNVVDDIARASARTRSGCRVTDEGSVSAPASSGVLRCRARFPKGMRVHESSQIASAAGRSGRTFRAHAHRAIVCRYGRETHPRCTGIDGVRA